MSVSHSPDYRDKDDDDDVISLMRVSTSPAQTMTGAEAWSAHFLFSVKKWNQSQPLLMIVMQIIADLRGLLQWYAWYVTQQFNNQLKRRRQSDDVHNIMINLNIHVMG